MHKYCIGSNIVDVSYILRDFVIFKFTFKYHFIFHCILQILICRHKPHVEKRVLSIEKLRKILTGIMIC